MIFLLIHWGEKHFSHCLCGPRFARASTVDHLGLLWFYSRCLGRSRASQSRAAFLHGGKTSWLRSGGTPGETGESHRSSPVFKAVDESGATEADIDLMVLKMLWAE